MFKFLIPGESLDMKRHFALLALCWSVIMLIAMGYAMNVEIKKKESFAIFEAQIAFDKDVIYRRWNAMHGGVYAVVSKDTTPNPYLHVPERDVITPSGRHLTMINPAYMTRQIHALENRTSAIIVKSHITSLKPLNPANAPYEWEKRALTQFQNGKKEYTELVEIDGSPFLRFMKPFFTEKSCLKCHGAQGYREGDLRGGISVTVPIDKVNRLERENLLMSWSAYFVLWLLGLAGLAVGTWRQYQYIQTMNFTEEELLSFKNALDRISDAILMFKPRTFRFFYVNHGAVELLGYNRAEFLLMTPRDIGLGNQETDNGEFLSPLIEGKKKLLHFFGEIKGKDGKSIPVGAKIQLMESRNRGDYFVAILRDLTKRIEMEKERDRLAADLLQAQKLESVGQLAAGIAHEINTPTQYVGTNIDFLDEAFQDMFQLMDAHVQLVEEAEKENFASNITEKIRETEDEVDLEFLREEIPSAIEQSREGIKRVTSIVRAMKDFSHPRSREKEPADLNKLIETTVTIARNEWKYVAEMNLVLAHDLPLVPCLSDEMGQVILNIIVNAAHAIGEKLGDNPKGEKGEITIITSKHDQWAEIRISDTGTGMPADMLHKIFEPFFTTKEVGRGTGQGLAIARNVVVEKHGGTIDVESEAGAGTSFIIRLPITD